MSAELRTLKARVPKEFWDRIKKYQHSNQLDTQTAAIMKLIEIGLEQGLEVLQNAEKNAAMQQDKDNDTDKTV